MSDKPLTSKQSSIYEQLVALTDEGIHPTVRSLADRLETRQHSSERWSDDEVRGLLERLEKDGRVSQYEGPRGEQRYFPIVHQDLGPSE